MCRRQREPARRAPTRAPAGSVATTRPAADSKPPLLGAIRLGGVR